MEQDTIGVVRTRLGPGWQMRKKDGMAMVAPAQLGDFMTLKRKADVAAGVSATKKNKTGPGA